MGKLPYWTCPKCGSNVGHGERCDCRIDTQNRKEMNALYGQKNVASTKSDSVAKKT